MVLSLPVPSFVRASSTPPRPADADAPAPQSRRRRGSAAGSSSSSSSNRSLWRSSTSGVPDATASSPSNQPIILEALRNNPFGSTSRSRSIQLSIQEVEEQKREQEELNASLETLARIFPDVRIEVFRELLVRFDGQSRLQVCVEQLLRHKKEWVSGRWNIPDGQQQYGKDGKAGERPAYHSVAAENLVPPEERFRSDEYKAAVRMALSKEFSSLSKSTLDAVLAEVNFSYVRARPTLRDLSRRTWRATFNSIFPSFKRKKDKDEHPFVTWYRHAGGDIVPRLKETGCAELNGEIHAMFVAPVLLQHREEQESGDFRIASELNEKEAQAADALYECECCFADVTFEQIATCSANTHIICYTCIQRTISEALFGQGWGKSVDLEHSTLKCIAPLSVGACEGCLHPEIVRQAVLLDTAGPETYRKFEDRLASDTLIKSQLKLIRCPFCSYAEADPVYHPSSRGIVWRVRRDGGILSSVLMTILILDLIPFLLPILLVLMIVVPTYPNTVFNNALRHLCFKLRPKRFTCAHPSCQRVSCMTCEKPWQDPHVCHEPLLLDLRATVEAARTAAVKRTCPRCGLSFVKSSGCNKLTCVCGYSMCYLCRKALGPQIRGVEADRPRRPRLQALDGPADDGDERDAENSSEDEFEEPEGYKHFCEHFRINPGSSCTECSKCDLYQAEDEEAVARRAGEKAEREWIIRQGESADSTSASALGLRNVNQDLSAGANGNSVARRASNALWDLQLTHGKPWSYWLGDVWSEGRWKLEAQVLVNWVVEQVLVIDEI
ncbi:hypothetical protein N7532_009261 [Penicillium argentinense]|uniref:RING-type domain-containing protein n=1 Tax=Penicillium argentinense TaxID=1131581 RepID=A0A9W9EZ13_9EURO|nr:uncharacterized protein N7532_009261 [Penicillium argentinense]KAJ5090577.1 hypothetical protein N7532_009261 [Penicillium argentinense]